MKKSWTGLAIGAVAVVMMAAPVSAKAAALKIWMDQFKSDYLPLHGETTSLTVQQNPAFAYLNPFLVKSQWKGWAPVNLPVGTTIKRVVYVHAGDGHNVACNLYRVKFGQEMELIGNSSASPVDASIVALLVPDANKLVVMAGYRYFVTIALTSQALVRGVKIVY